MPLSLDGSQSTHVSKTVKVDSNEVFFFHFGDLSMCPYMEETEKESSSMSLVKGYQTS